MDKLDKYKVELKNMKVDEAQYDFTLDNQFFEDVDSPEIQKGDVKVALSVKKTFAGVFILNFQIDGVVTVPCDRCLDDMEISVSSNDELKVKLGEEFSDDSDIVVVPEMEGYINVSWFIYEFIVLSLPMRHVHALGECNEEMIGKLGDHLTVSANDTDDDVDSLDDDEDEFEGMEMKKIVDPRFNELKKILDNN